MSDGLTAVLCVYLPLLGILIGGSASSLVLHFLGRENRDAHSLRLSRELIETVAGNAPFLFIAALLPLPLVALLWQRTLPPPAPLPGFSWILPFGALLSGCLLLSFYRSALRRTADLRILHFRAGAAGLLAIFSASFLLFLPLGTLFNPEKLDLVRSNPVFLLSWRSLAGFLLFLAVSFGLTGGIVLRFPGRAPEGKEGPGPEYRDRARSVGASLAIGGALAVPVPVVLNLLSLPSTGLSIEVFAAAAVLVLLALAATLVLTLQREKKAGRLGLSVSMLFVLMFLAALAGDRAAVGNAFLGRAAPVPPPGAARIPGEPSADKGKAVFESACRACHLFEAKLVGPPLNEAVPKYRGDLEKLKHYIREPSKVDPSYPLMPHLGLKEEEIDAVARYLLGGMGEKIPPGKPVAAAPPGAEKGKAIFETVCAGCHRFDTRLVGPPFNEVVPKYKGDVEKLKRFIGNPVKVDPGYPSMPNLGLKEEEIDAVARYLLEKVKGGG
jgi:cytochrome c551/c552